MLVWLGLGQGTPWGRVGSYRCTCESMIGKDVRWALAFAKTLAAATLRKVLHCKTGSTLGERRRAHLLTLALHHWPFPRSWRLMVPKDRTTSSPKRRKPSRTRSAPAS